MYKNCILAGYENVGVRALTSQYQIPDRNWTLEKYTKS